MPQTTAIDGTGPVLVRVVSDGTAGMRLQALALAESLQRARPDWKCDEFTITPHPLTRAMPRLAAWLPSMPLYGSTPPGRGTGRATGGLAGGRAGVPGAASLSRRPHAGRYPDIMITCGRRMAGFALAMRRRARADGKPMQIVQLQDPRLPPAMFDALVVPRHDRARGANVLVTTGSLNRLTLDSIKSAMMALPSRWLTTTRHTAVAVMIGGDNRRYRITPEMADGMADRLARFAAGAKATLMIMASRRTPDGLVERLCANLPAGGAMLPQKGEPNVYPGVLGLAQAVIVTSDSVNMASEAAITGKPVLIAPWQSATDTNPSGEAGRIRAFHDHMFAGSHTAPMAGTIPNGSFERLDEMAGLTEELLTLLGR
jgi:mitochondrial fission protein ELM1